MEIYKCCLTRQEKERYVDCLFCDGTYQGLECKCADLNRGRNEQVLAEKLKDDLLKAHANIYGRDEEIANYKLTVLEANEIIAELKNKVAQLEFKLSKSIEIPFDIGDTVYNIIGQRSDTLRRYVTRAVITKNNLFHYLDLYKRNLIFLSADEANAVLKSINEVLDETT